MEAFEYTVLKEKVCNPRSEYLKPSMEQMQRWVADISNRRRSLCKDAFDSAEEVSFRELELRYDVRDVWGHTTTPAMQTLECIQEVKQALVKGATEDSISTSTFSILVGLSVVAAMAVVLVWELYFRPHGHAAPLH